MRNSPLHVVAALSQFHHCLAVVALLPTFFLGRVQKLVCLWVILAVIFAVPFHVTFGADFGTALA